MVAHIVANDHVLVQFQEIQRRLLASAGTIGPLQHPPPIPNKQTNVE